MPADLLHRHPNFADLVAIIAAEKKILPALGQPPFDALLATLEAWRAKL